MIAILLSWIYIFFTAINFGLFFSKRLKINTVELVFTTILGLFTVTLCASIWAFWLPIAIEFHCALLLSSTLLCFRNKTELQLLFVETRNQIKSFKNTIKWLFLFFSIVILALCTSKPYIIDNETYYLQTIKWLNEYGLVKGLANLDLFFGQTSGWHITQSVYNLSFLYDSFNDLNGFLFLFFNLFVFTKINNYLITGKKTELLFGLTSITYLFLFQFISAPSPDLAIYIFGFLLFYNFISIDQFNTTESFIKIAILALFASYCKVTASLLLLFPIACYILYYKAIHKNLVPLKIVGTTTLLLFIFKNSTLTGYPLFPIQYAPFPNLNYKIPKEIMDFFFSRDMMNDFYIPYNPQKQISLFFRAKQYFWNNGIDSIIGIATAITIAVSPYFIMKSKQKIQLWLIYFCFITLLTLLYFSSPQYRFYVYFTLFFGILGLAHFLKKSKTILILLIANAMFIAILLPASLFFEKTTPKNIFILRTSFHLKNVWLPEPITNDQLQFKGDSRGNLKFNTPIGTKFWINGNGNLPAVNEEQLLYFETNFHYMPQQRSHNLGDGFYAQKVTGHD
jgi:hypothetical protein